MEEIYKKWAEFMQCLKHMHMRGMADVVKETKPLIDKVDGTFEDFIKYVKSISDVEIEIPDDQFNEMANKDPFLKNIKILFEERDK